MKYIVGRPGLELPAPQFVRVDAPCTPVFRNTHALPRVLIADVVQVAQGNAARWILRDGAVDARRTAVVETPLAGDAAPQPATPGASDAATVRHYRDTFVEIETETGGRRLLVLTGLWYPGWRPSSMDARRQIVRANFAFRGVSISAGRHVVQVRLSARFVAVRAAISLAALALTLVLFAVRPRA